MAKPKTGSAGAARGRKQAAARVTRPTKPGTRAKGPRRTPAGRASAQARPPKSRVGPKRKTGRRNAKASKRQRAMPARTTKVFTASARPAVAASAVDLDRSVLAIRTGRREMKEHLAEHTETSPVLTGGDVDANWEAAFSSGDDAPGGDNPTPDQDVVEEIGRALGVEYQDNEELRGAAKLEERDRFRWEYNPASSEDYAERTRKRSDES